MTRKSGTRTLNFLCFVLWRKVFMPSRAPRDPPRRASPRSTLSGILHQSFLAHSLSHP